MNLLNDTSAFDASLACASTTIRRSRSRGVLRVGTTTPAAAILSTRSFWRSIPSSFWNSFSNLSASCGRPCLTPISIIPDRISDQSSPGSFSPTTTARSVSSGKTDNRAGGSLSGARTLASRLADSILARSNSRSLLKRKTIERQAGRSKNDDTAAISSRSRPRIIVRSSLRNIETSPRASMIPFVFDGPVFFLTLPDIVRRRND